MKIYLAARYSRRLELCGARDVLTAAGHEITSRWLDGSHQLDNTGRPLGDRGELLFEAGSAEVDHFRHKFATDDLDDVLAADLLIAFTEEPRSGNSRGGRHVELGIALGARKRVVIVGPRENVFCWLPQVSWHPDWQHLAAAWTAGGGTPYPDGTDLVAEGAGPLLDPDCRDAKHGSCVGAPCECSCHPGGAR